MPPIFGRTYRFTATGQLRAGLSAIRCLVTPRDFNARTLRPPVRRSLLEPDPNARLDTATGQRRFVLHEGRVLALLLVAEIASSDEEHQIGFA